MTGAELARRIELPQAVIEPLRRANDAIDWAQESAEIDRMTNSETAAQAYAQLEKDLGEDEGHFKMLACELEGARRVYTRFQERHIPDRVFTDTMKCFTRFIRECGKKHGKMFFDRGWWSYRQISMNLFRIGALEYQFIEHDGENAVTLHIPSDAPFDAESVDESLWQARAFFQTHYPEYVFTRFTCDSWLMSPVLREILPEDSNILAFQRRFTLVAVNTESDACVNWVFGTPAETATAEFPEATRLQRAVKRLMLEGRHIGSACGEMEA